MIRAIVTAICLVLPLSAKAIEIQEVTSPGGFDAWLVQENSIPFVSIELEFEGGASLDLPGKRGATNLMMGLLEEGAGDMDSRAFAIAVENLSASFRFDTRDDSVTITARMLTENRDEALALLKAALTNPRFDQDALDRVRQQVLSNIAGDATDPQEISAKAFDDIAFEAHPYETDYVGTADSVGSLTQADMVAAHRNAFAQDRVHIGAAGDISATELAEVLDYLLSDLPAMGAALPLDTVVQLSGGVTVVPFDTPQAEVIFGHEGIARDDPDFFAAFILNHVMGGGGFEARLMTEVREKRGLTYGIGSYLVPKSHAALYMGSFASSNDRVATAIEVVRDQWRDVAENGISEVELEDAKTFLTGAYPLRFDGNSRIAGILTGMQVVGLPADYIETRNDQVRTVTMADIRRVAARLFRPDDLHFVVVGQPDGLTSTN